MSPGGGMVDAMDLKSIEDKTSCEFESRPGHFLILADIQ